MPGFIACKLCPELVFVPTDFKKYTYYSDLTRKVFRKYDPNFLAASLNEAYLDVTEVCKEKGPTGEEIAKEFRDGVYEETGLTCSAGVAPNRLHAKIFCQSGILVQFSLLTKNMWKVISCCPVEYMMSI